MTVFTERAILCFYQIIKIGYVIWPANEGCGDGEKFTTCGTLKNLVYHSYPEDTEGYLQQGYL
jgi:hypothetical protein